MVSKLYTIGLITAALFTFLTTPLVTKSALADDKSAGSSALMLAPVEQPITGNKRIRVLNKFLSSYDSELAPYAPVFVARADDYNIDWRLLVAISGVESTFGHFLPANCYNSWGFGIYGNQVRCFSSYNEAIDTISKSIREDYIDKWGAKDVYDIGHYYAASPTWAQRVAYFMSKIDRVASQSTPDDLSLSL